MKHEKLYTIKNKKRINFYLLISKIGTEKYYYHTLSIEEGELRLYSGFRTYDGLTGCISCDSEAIFYQNKKLFYFPVEDRGDGDEEDQKPAGLYDKYKFNGLVFELEDGDVTNPNLNAGLDKDENY